MYVSFFPTLLNNERRLKTKMNQQREPALVALRTTTILVMAVLPTLTFSSFSTQSSYGQLVLPQAPTADPTTITALGQNNTSSGVERGPTLSSTSDGNQSTDLDAARQQYLAAWNNNAFSSQFDVFIEEGSSLGYGVYRDHVPANIFWPGETIVLYVKPLGFGHQPIIDRAVRSIGSNITQLYLINMTADYIISDSAGFELQRVEDVPVGELISHRQNLEMFLTLTLSQEQPFPIGDYILTYVVHDQVTGQSFQLDKRITIDDHVPVNSSPTLPAEEDDNSMQPVSPQQPQQGQPLSLETE